MSPLWDKALVKMCRTLDHHPHLQIVNTRRGEAGRRNDREGVGVRRLSLAPGTICPNFPLLRVVLWSFRIIVQAENSPLGVKRLAISNLILPFDSISGKDIN